MKNSPDRTEKSPLLFSVPERWILEGDWNGGCFISPPDHSAGLQVSVNECEVPAALRPAHSFLKSIAPIFEASFESLAGGHALIQYTEADAETDQGAGSNYHWQLAKSETRTRIWLAVFALEIPQFTDIKQRNRLVGIVNESVRKAQLNIRRNSWWRFW